MKIGGNCINFVIAMKLFYKILLLLLPAVMSWSCSAGSSNADERIVSAVSALEQGDYNHARSICDALVESDAAMTPSQLGRVSILYMKINEGIDEQTDDVDKAADCFRRAFEQNADSAVAFYTDCSLDDLRYVMMLTTIVKSIEAPMPFPEEYSDSVLTDSLMIQIPD